MKKFYVLLVVMVLLFSISASSFGAVDFSGNLRAWYKSNLSGDTGGFVFDRLALKVNAKASDNDGVFGELRFLYGGNLTTATTAAGFGEMTYDQVYYYHKNFFTNNDELDFGFVFLPFYNDKYMGIIKESVAKNYAGAKNSTGLKYNIKGDGFEASVAVTNWKNNYATLSSGDGNGFDEALRVSFKVMEGLNLGVGYVNDSTVTGGSIVTSTGSAVLDATFTMDPIGVFFEYVNVSPNSGSSKSGFYIEPNIKIMDGLTAYVGAALVKSNSLASSDWYIGGLKYQVAAKTAIQAEFISYPDSIVSNCFGIRVRQDF